MVYVFTQEGISTSPEPLEVSQENPQLVLSLLLNRLVFR